MTRWRGTHGYHHRRKACAIAAGMQRAERTLFVDTDTLFTAIAAPASSNSSSRGRSVMDRFEYDWKDVHLRRPDYQKLGRDLRSHGVTPDNGFKLYNSGLCGVTDGDSALFEESIRLIDEWTLGGFEIHTIEQIALSFAMRERQPVEARKLTSTTTSRKNASSTPCRHTSSPSMASSSASAWWTCAPKYRGSNRSPPPGTD